MAMLVSIKFCGGCNPKIDRVGVAGEISRGLRDRGVTVDYNNLDADFIVYVSGCSVSCATHDADTGKPFVVIAGLGFDARAVGEDCLATLAIEKVGQYLENLEQTL